MTSTAAATAKVLADAGIERVFGLPGGEILVPIHELRRAGVDFVLMRHEANAGIAAAVYGNPRGTAGRRPDHAWSGRRQPDAAAHSSAYLDQEPLLAISAQIPDDFPASHTHQLLPLHDDLPADRAVRRQDHRRERARRRAARAGGVHGAPVRRVVPHAVRSRSAEAGGRDGGSRASGFERRRPPLSAEMLASRRRRSRPRSRAPKRPLVVIGLGIDPANAARDPPVGDASGTCRSR